MGLRYLLLALALWGLYRIIRHLLSQRKPDHPVSPQTKAVDSVQCAHCGLHLPREEALRKGDEYFCSRAHLTASGRDTET